MNNVFWKVCSIQCRVYWSQFSAHYGLKVRRMDHTCSTLYTVCYIQYTVYIVYCTGPYTVKVRRMAPIYSVQCIVYSIQYTVYWSSEGEENGSFRRQIASRKGTAGISSQLLLKLVWCVYSAQQNYTLLCTLQYSTAIWSVQCTTIMFSTVYSTVPTCTLQLADINYADTWTASWGLFNIGLNRIRQSWHQRQVKQNLASEV